MNDHHPGYITKLGGEKKRKKKKKKNFAGIIFNSKIGQRKET
jgi:hypothetical protein